MSQENVEIVRDYFEATNERDFARAMRYYADDVELVVSGDAFLEAGTFKGTEEVSRSTAAGRRPSKPPGYRRKPQVLLLAS